MARKKAADRPIGLKALIKQRLLEEARPKRVLEGDGRPTSEEVAQAEERERLRLEDPDALAEVQWDDAMSLGVAKSAGDLDQVDALERRVAQLAKAGRYVQRKNAGQNSGQRRAALAEPSHLQWRERARELKAEGLGASKAAEVIETEAIGRGRRKIAIYNVIRNEFQ